MNCKEYHLPELELATGQVREALQAIIHTILFIRSPGPVAPNDVHCEGFNLTYTRIANDAVGSHPKKKNLYLDKKVDDSIEDFLKSLVQIGPELLSGCLTISFFERRASKQLFGLVSHEEKIIFEQWILHVVVNNTPRPVNDDSASKMERQRIQDTAEAMLRSVFMKVFQFASGVEGGVSGDRSLDHIPPTLYEFEIRCTKKMDDRENVYSRVANMPALLNLDGS
jgi:autophagy-related protein 101